MRESASTDLREPQGSNPLGPPGPELLSPPGPGLTWRPWPWQRAWRFSWRDIFGGLSPLFRKAR